MPGRFEGLTDVEWQFFEDLFPEPEKRGRGMPAVPPRFALNSMLYVLITGCRWCDLPKGEHWASKSSAHRRLQRWQSNGTLEAIQSRVLGLAHNQGLIKWDAGAVDGSFSPWQGRR